MRCIYRGNEHDGQILTPMRYIASSWESNDLRRNEWAEQIVGGGFATRVPKLNKPRRF
jgi:hypothetical protein